eukprot:1481664-Karenia_brevis.AAC.1
MEKDWQTTMAKRLRTMLNHVRNSQSLARPPKWVKDLMKDENEGEADEDVENESEAVDVPKQPDVVNVEDDADAAGAKAKASSGEDLKDELGEILDEVEGRAAKYLYGFCWEKMLAWRVEAKKDGKKTKERKQ